MKEATGELNMTVITVVAIAAVGAFFMVFVWPAIQSSLQINTVCTGGSGTLVDDTPATCTRADDGTLTCNHPSINSNAPFVCENAAS